MGKKIIGIFVCLLFLLTAVSTVAARQERTVYKNCYIEVEADQEDIYNYFKYLYLRPLLGDRAFVFCWVLQWRGSNASITIYDQKGGNEVWNGQNQEGIWATKLFMYRGLYTWFTEYATSVLTL